MSKKYYWLKLNENFFEKDEIKVIEGMINGEKYIIFYLKLLLKSINNEGKLMFRNMIPYTAEILSSVTNTNIDTVKVAIDIFRRLGLIEELDDGSLFMIEIKNMIGSETMWAQKKRIQRDKQSAIKNENRDYVQSLSLDCPTDKELDRELNKELDKESISDKKLIIIINTWNDLNLSKIIAIKNKRLNLLKDRIKEYGFDEVIKVIKTIKKSSFLRGNNQESWIISFDWLINPNNFIKVLEGQYNDKRLDEKKRCGEYNGIYDFSRTKNTRNNEKEIRSAREKIDF